MNLSERIEQQFAHIFKNCGFAVKLLHFSSLTIPNSNSLIDC